ncbi:aminoglycoside phosphotransferase family protein [Streptomyces californicus]|uniref:aminoglycoside phosphotransferase family protein n=1 Tax=Streptomyces californicus TaxID=67351 RepID=UPI0036C14E44
MGCEPPRRLERALGEMYGDAAAADWLAGLPELTERALTAGDGLTAERVAAPGGRSSLVVLVRRADGTPAALKIAPPAARPDLERAALEHWNGWGAVRTLDAPGADASGTDAAGPGASGPGASEPGASERGASGPDAEAAEDAAGGLLLERLHHEVSLRSLPEAKALLEAAGTVRRLWVEPPAGHGFETVAERTARQSAGMRAAAEADPELAPLVAAALAARAELVEGASELLLLHGNFRQSKVLSGERAPWLTVGPEPVVGERAYDLARLVRDRAEDLIAASGGPVTARRRVKKLAESLEVDQARLHGWTLFRAVESGTRALAEGRRQMGEVNLEFAGWL